MTKDAEYRKAGQWRDSMCGEKWMNRLGRNEEFAKDVEEVGGSVRAKQKYPLR